MFYNLCKHFSFPITIPSFILLQPFLYNKNIKIDSKPIYIEEFTKHNIIFLYDHF